MTPPLRWVSDGRGDGTATFGPEDVLAYIYAVFHAPSYRSRYAEFLKIDFPRVPLTHDAALFWELVEQGRALIGLHLLDEAPTQPPPEGEEFTLHSRQHPGLSSSPSGGGWVGAPPGEVAPGYPKYNDGRVYINAVSCFDGVPEAVWNLHIGGYQVAHKWLKDRKGRTLSDEDAAHYRKIIVALDATITRMAAIDEIITEHGGWPLPGSQEPVDVVVQDFFGARGEAAGPHPGRPVGGVRPRTRASSTTVAASKPKRECTPPTIDDYSRDELRAALLKQVKRQFVIGTAPAPPGAPGGPL